MTKKKGSPSPGREMPQMPAGMTKMPDRPNQMQTMDMDEVAAETMRRNQGKGKKQK